MIAFGFKTGTNAVFGMDAAFQITPKLNIRIGYNTTRFEIRDYETNFNRFEYYASIDADMRMSNFEIMVERPIRLFKININAVAGLAFFPINEASVKGEARDTFPFFDIGLTPGEIGYVKGTLSYRSNFSPYIGISFGKAIPKKKLGFSFQFGTYYKGRPTMDIEGSNILRSIDRFNNEKIIEDGISSYRWWPVLAFRVSYKLNPYSKEKDSVAIMSKRGKSKNDGGKKK